MDKKIIAGIVLAILGMIAAYFGLDLSGCKVTDRPAILIEAPAE